MFTVLLLLVCVLFLLLKLCLKPSRFPPGPFRWPLVGSIFDFIGRQPHSVLCDYGRRYGNVIGLYLGLQPLVVISGVQEVREALARAEMQARPRRVADTHNDERYGVLFTEGPHWQELRRFSLRYLRDLGVGRRHIENLLHSKVLTLLDEVKRLAGPDYKTPIPVRQIANLVGSNVVLHLLAGESLERTDPRFTHLMLLMKRLASLSDASGGLLDAFPPLVKIFPSITEYKVVREFRDEVARFMKGFINSHKARINQEPPTDYLDFFLSEKEKRGEGDPTFNDKQLMGVCKDLFVAGSDTTAGALSLALLYMVRNPDVQAKVQRELDEVVGSERLPGFDDRQKLPYVEATLMETLRMGNVVPLAVPHATSSEAGIVNFRGYQIPRGCRILINLYAMHMDSEYWTDPESFRPERFLDDNGRVRSHDAFLPFGSGKRSCLGESLARSNLLIAFSALLLQYNISIPEGMPQPSMKPEGGFTLCAENFKFQVQPRF